MKPLRISVLFPRTLCFVAALGAACVAWGQMTLPVVNFRPLDPEATWEGDPGAIMVFRDGPTNAALNLFYRIGGTAVNGVDYEKIGNWIEIPAGERTNVITIKPVNAGQDAIKTVELTLLYPITMPPVNYIIGSRSNAAVVIRPAGNLPPMVKIVTPADGAAFPAPVNIPICAEAHDLDGFVKTVEFFAGMTSLGVTTNNPLSMDPRNPFCLVWSNVPPGTYVLTAKATDDDGAASVSPPVRIQVGRPPPLPLVAVKATDPNASEPGVLTVIDPGVFTIFRSGGTNEPLRVHYRLLGTARNGEDYRSISNAVVIPEGSFTAEVVVDPMRDELVEGRESVVLRLEPPLCATMVPPPPGCYLVGTPAEAVVWIADQDTPPTNYPPMVRIISPPNGAVFRSPIDLPVFAYARDVDDPIASVEFFANERSLGFGTLLPPNPASSVRDTNVYGIVWSNAPAGLFALRAEATDKRGATAMSDPVKISILPSPPPPTNRPALVSIFAPDPIAIEGTNCWVWRGLTNPVPSWSCWPTGSFRFYTNCGPKNATFAVRRHGETNLPLRVTYSIGGTASNGVDYAELSGVVIIPAGARSALVTVVPVDDNQPERLETVVLKLNPSRQLPPEYFVGRPAAAAAVIVDGSKPKPDGTTILADRCFHLSAAGPDGAWFRIEASSDMINWTELSVGQVVNGSIDFVDPDAQDQAARFYRAVPEAGLPPE